MFTISQRTPQIEALITQYIALRQKAMPKTYVNEADAYDLDPRTFFIIKTNESGKVISGGRVLIKTLPGDLLPLEEKFKIDLGKMLPLIDHKETSFAELGGVATDPDITGFSPASQLQTETYEFFKKGGFEVDILCALSRMANAPILHRVIKKADLNSVFLEDESVKGPAGKLILIASSNDKSLPLNSRHKLETAKSYDVQNFAPERYRKDILKNIPNSLPSNQR